MKQRWLNCQANNFVCVCVPIITSYLIQILIKLTQKTGGARLVLLEIPGALTKKGSASGAQLLGFTTFPQTMELFSDIQTKWPPGRYVRAIQLELVS